MEVLGFVVLVAVFVWPIWFLVTMNDMKSSLKSIYKELRLQGDWLELIATNKMFEQERDGSEVSEEFWCPDCREQYDTEVGNKRCPSCNKVGHPYSGR
jgi:Zn finger protein HypA/HybF involved in hydrogenase expression